jgi:hypothetical protein
VNKEERKAMGASRSRDVGRVPNFTSQWARYVVGFSVSVAVGLAPYLGKIKVPLFTPMLSLVPDSLQDIAVPLSSASMGISAVVVQWYASRRRVERQIHRWFARTAISCVVLLVLFSTLELLCVVRIEVPAAGGVASFAVGPINPHKPPCEMPTLTRAACITQQLKTLDETRIESHFGETQANVSKLFLLITYITFMSCFGVMVGLLTLSMKSR